MAEREDNVADRLNHVIAQFFSEEEKSMVVKWMIQAEVIDSDGSGSMWTLSSPGMSMWDRLGIAQYLLLYYADIMRRVNDDRE